MNLHSIVSFASICEEDGPIVMDVKVICKEYRLPFHMSYQRRSDASLRPNDQEAIVSVCYVQISSLLVEP